MQKRLTPFRLDYKHYTQKSTKVFTAADRSKESYKIEVYVL